MVFAIILGVGVGAVIWFFTDLKTEATMAGICLAVMIGFLISDAIAKDAFENNKHISEKTCKITLATSAVTAEKEDDVIVVFYESGEVITINAKDVSVIDSDENCIVKRTYEPKGFMKIFGLGKVRYDVYFQLNR